jgi:UMF1 family MFS transporter
VDVRSVESVTAGRGLHPDPVGRWAGAAWVLYDVAYSASAFVFSVRYFPAWVINDLDRPDWYVSAGLAAAVVTVLVLSPILGRYADRHGRRKRLLTIFTLCSSILMATLGFLPTSGNLLAVLITAAMTVGFGQLAIAQFDPLLAEIGDADRRSKLSGLAVGLGFLGTIASLGLVAGLLVGNGDKQRAFLPLALLYLLLALPALRIAPESRPVPRNQQQPGLLSLFRDRGGDSRDARRFVIARFLYCDALLTVSGYLTVYMARIGGFSNTAQSAVLAVAIVAAASGAFATGRMLPRHGPRRAILAVLPFAAAALLLTATFAKPWTVWLGAPIIGAALGTAWTADRIFMLRLTPAAKRGEWFAYFNSANRAATAVGPLLIWSGCIWLLSGQTNWTSKLTATRLAVIALAGTAALGWSLVRRTPDTDPAARPRTAG